MCFVLRELFEISPRVFPCFASVVVQFIFAFVCLPCVGFWMQRMPMMGIVLLMMIADIRPTNHTGDEGCGDEGCGRGCVAWCGGRGGVGVWWA